MKTKIVLISAKLVIMSLILGVFFVHELAMAEGCLYINKTIKLGGRQSREDVVALQNFLYERKYLNLRPTGYFGKLTQNAVKKFQIDSDILVGGIPNGIVGPQTRARISQISCLSQVVPPTPLIPPQPEATPTTTPISVETKTVKQTIVVQNKEIKLPYTSDNFFDWKSSWGKVSTSSLSLFLEASPNTYGAQAVFPLSNSLTDYKFSANISINRGSFILTARYVDDDNFLACNFGGRTVEIIQRIKGLSTTVASAYVPEMPNSRFFFENINVSMNVKGKKVGCTVIGKEDNVTFSNIDETLLKGGIGIQNWNESLGVASLELKKVEITSI